MCIRDRFRPIQPVQVIDLFARQHSLDSVIRQMLQKRQHVVVCKAPALVPCGAEVVLLPTLARKLSCCLQGPQLRRSKAKCLQLNALAPELSCCLQDRPRRSRPAKPLRRNALGPKLRCCLQDHVGAASGPALAVFPGFGRLTRGCLLYTSRCV